jgi:hypothetical protein
VLARERQMAEQHLQMLAQNSQLTEQIASLTNELRQPICVPPDPTRTVSV